METAIQMLSVAMPNCEHLEPFTEFLQEQTEYKTINRDQWMGFLRFTQQVSLWLHCEPLLCGKGTWLKHAASMYHHFGWGGEWGVESGL